MASPSGQACGCGSKICNSLFLASWTMDFDSQGLDVDSFKIHPH